NAPAGSNLHSAVWTGSEMIIWGGLVITECNGFYCFGVQTERGARYDPVSDRWSGMSPALAVDARAHHSTIWTGRQMVVQGGAANHAGMNSTLIYDLSSDSWTRSNGGPRSTGHSAVWTGRHMLVWGSFGEPGLVFEPESGMWSEMSALGAPLQ